MYVLDTNTLVYFFKGLGGVAERMLATPPSDIAVPAVVVYELEVGLAKSTQPEQRRRQVERLLDVVVVLPFGRPEARASAAVRARLESAGKPIGPLDTLIAGTALAAGRVLVTHNTNEFARVDGLVLDDWF